MYRHVLYFMCTFLFHCRIILSASTYFINCVIYSMLMASLRSYTVWYNVILTSNMRCTPVKLREKILTHRLICSQNSFPRGHNAQSNFMQLLLLVSGKGGELVCHFDVFFQSTKRRKWIYELAQ